VWNVHTSGGENLNISSNPYGIRPALTLPQSLSIINGAVVTNQAPTINGSNDDLGRQTGPFQQNYTVTDPDPGDVITVTEQLNGQQVRRYTATSGAQQQFNITQEWFSRAVNGSNTMTVIATDQAGATATRTWTFSRDEDQIDIQLSTPFPADAAPARIWMNITRQIPMGATFQVLVTNNANDPSPIWEDATAAVLNGLIYNFSNRAALNNFGVNIRVKVNRNGATGPCWVSMIGGNFD
jgi:hypothetical protein